MGWNVFALILKIYTELSWLYCLNHHLVNMDSSFCTQRLLKVAHVQGLLLWPIYLE